MKQIDRTVRTERMFSMPITFAVISLVMIAFAASSFGQNKVRFVEEMNQVTRYNKKAPVTSIKPAAQKFAPVIKSGNAAINNRLAIKAAQNRQLLQKAGEAALKNRKTIAQAREVAKKTTLVRRAAIAGTGVGLVLVGGVWIAESLIGDSPDDIAIDAAASIVQGKRLDKVVNDIGKRVDPARLAKKTKRNLDKTGKDISNAFNFIGREIGKIRL